MNLEDFSKLFIGLATVGVVMVVAFLIVAEGQTQAESVENENYTGSACDTSTTCNATRGIQDAMSDAVSWLPIVIITIIGSLLIGLVMFFKRR